MTTRTKPKSHLATQEVITLHVDLIAAAFKSVELDILPSGAVEIKPKATEEDLKNILIHCQQEGTICSTLRFFVEGDIWNQIQERLGKRKGIHFLISIFGQELGRKLYWRYRNRGHIAKLVPACMRDYTKSQREILRSLGCATDKLDEPISNPEFNINDTGQIYFEFDFRNRHRSVNVPAQQIAKLIRYTNN